jgi:predicted RNase H-like nuclease (RuvC/YqgF family)
LYQKKGGGLDGNCSLLKGHRAELWVQKQISQLQGIITSLEDKLKTTETEKSKLENDYKELLCNTTEVKENGGTSKTVSE